MFYVLGVITFVWWMPQSITQEYTSNITLKPNCKKLNNMNFKLVRRIGNIFKMKPRNQRPKGFLIFFTWGWNIELHFFKLKFVLVKYICKIVTMNRTRNGKESIMLYVYKKRYSGICCIVVQRVYKKKINNKKYTRT